MRRVAPLLMRKIIVKTSIHPVNINGYSIQDGCFITHDTTDIHIIAMITLPQSATEMDIMARAAIASLPADLRTKLGNVILRIEEFANEEQLEALDIENAWNLAGLYEGTPLPKKSAWTPANMPPVLFLFRQPLLRECQKTGEDLGLLVRQVVIYEAGHHFGYSEDEVHELKDWVI